MPPLLHIIGRKNHGKTTLVLALIEALTAEGLRIGTIKHSSHRHEFDRDGSDSHRHRISGAAPAAVVSDNLAALYFEPASGDDPFDRLLPFYADVDLVIVEGDHQRPGVKIEVWRAVNGTEPLSGEADGVIAIVSDDEPPVKGLPVIRRDDSETLLNLVRGHFDLVRR